MRQLSGIIERANTFFGPGIAGVEVRIGVHPAAPGALGSVFDNRIYLNPGLGKKHPLTVAHILGHELAHLVQQRQGRVRPGRAKAGVAFNDDPALESEADRLGRGFALGVRSDSFPVTYHGAVRRLRPSPPVLQCLVHVGGRPISAVSELSPKGQLLLDLIPQGPAWLNSGVKASCRHAFDDEAALLVGVQLGLHGSETLLLPRLKLLVHPERLQELAPNELECIRATERSSNENTVIKLKAQKALKRHSLWADEELTHGDGFLNEAGVSSELVFRSRSLADRIALLDLVSETEWNWTTSLQQEAGKFAVAHAQNLPEFIDYCQFYLAQLPDKEHPAPDQAEKRARFAETRAETLSDLLFDLLHSPSFERPPTATELPGALAQWSSRGYRVGFPRLSAALAHIEQYAELYGASGPAARQLIDRYMDRAQAHWVNRMPNTIQLSQDGRYRDYVYELPHLQAVLRLDMDGALSIGPLRRTAGQAPPDAGKAGTTGPSTAGPATAGPFPTGSGAASAGFTSSSAAMLKAFGGLRFPLEAHTPSADARSDHGLTG